MSVVLLGPQHVKPSFTEVLRQLGVRDRVALVTAGWQERETDDQGLFDGLGVQSVNTTLHARSEDVFARDPELAAAYKQRQEHLRLLQDFYRVRLEHAAEAARVISLRQVDPALIAEERHISLELVRRLDEDHLHRCRAVHAAFEDRWRPGQRDAVARHRKELAALIGSTAAVLVAGGHVAVLLNRLKLFDVVGLAGLRPLIAWSAGAMVLTEIIVLFHDHPPHGEAIAEVLDAGLGIAPRIVALPDPRLRLRLDDRARMGLLAQRFAPSSCVAMDHGARIFLERGRVTGAEAIQRLALDGGIQTRWPG